MGAWVRWTCLIAVGVFSILPLPESVLGARPEIAHWSSSPWLAALALAYLVSMSQLGCEYWLAGEFGESFVPKVARWWKESALRRWWLGGRPEPTEVRDVWSDLRPFLMASGYLGMLICSMNPIPGTPFSRFPAVVTWRTTGLRGGLAVILVGTLVRLIILYPVAAGMRSVLLP